MILHLSAPSGQSINDHIAKDTFSFRMIPVRCQDWELLGMQWQGQFYYNTCLPFGLRSAPCLFNEYAEALQWILINNHGLAHVLHYLDDYFIAGPPGSSVCAAHLSQFLPGVRPARCPSRDGEGGRSSVHPHLPGPRARLHTAAHPPSPRKAHGPPHRVAGLGSPHQSIKTQAALHHREAVLCHKGSSSGSALPAAPHLPQHNGSKPPSPPPPWSPGASRHCMVGRLSTNVERDGPLSQPRQYGSPRPPALYRHLRDTRLWSLLPG